MHNVTEKTILFNKSRLWWCSILLLTVSMILLALRWKNRRLITLANRIPGPKGTFLVGILPMLLDGPQQTIKNFLKLYRSNETTMYKTWILNRFYITLTQPEDIEFVLTNPKLIKKANEYAVAQESIMGQGIFSIEDPKKWKINRKKVSSGFSFTILKSFIPIFYYEAEVLNDILQKSSDLNSGNCELSGPIGMATMEMIGKTALDVTFNAQYGDKHPFIENLKLALESWEYRITHPWYMSKMLFRFSSMYKQHVQSQKVIYTFTDDIINKKLNELNQKAQNKKETEVEDDDVFKNPKTVIEILLDNYHEMTHEQVRDELITIMIGGQETTALTNACAIFMLAHHQEIQNKAYEELQTIFSSGDRNRRPTYDDLQQMKYLERIIKETMRFYPAVPMIGRHLGEEMQIGKYLCPAGATLIICPLFLQTSPLFYADPEKFNPDNFLPEACRGRHPYAYIPFSAGHRNCIGIKYGMIQMKITLSTLIRKNRFFPSERCPAPNLELMYLASLKLVDGCHVRIEPRAS